MSVHSVVCLHNVVRNGACKRGPNFETSVHFEGYILQTGLNSLGSQPLTRDAPSLIALNTKCGAHMPWTKPQVSVAHNAGFIYTMYVHLQACTLHAADFSCVPACCSCKGFCLLLQLISTLSLALMMGKTSTRFLWIGFLHFPRCFFELSWVPVSLSQSWCSQATDICILKRWCWSSCSAYVCSVHTKCRKTRIHGECCVDNETGVIHIEEHCISFAGWGWFGGTPPPRHQDL